jgi:hypothetical protein
MAMATGSKTGNVMVNIMNGLVPAGMALSDLGFLHLASRLRYHHCLSGPRAANRLSEFDYDADHQSVF